MAIPPTYGTRDSTQFHYPRTPVEEVKRETYYTIVDSSNGTIYVKKLNPINPLRLESNDPIVGILEVGRNKVEPVPIWSGSVYQKEIESFNDQVVIDGIRKKAEQTAVNAQVRLGVDRSVAATRAKNLISTGNVQLDPQGNQISTPAAPASSGTPDSPPVTFDPNTKTTITAKNINVKAEGILRYPFNIIDGESRKVSRTNYNGGIGGQDYLQIVIVEYKPVGSTFIRNRTNNSLSTKTKKEELKTTIILPIPSNIQDGNSVGYADGSLDGISAEVAGATNKVIDTFSGVTNQTMTDKMATAGNAIFGALNNMGDDLKNEWIRGLAARAAALPGIGNITREQLLARESGGVLNPNMELFFNGVSLRSFKFSFKLTPRNKDEGIEIKRIIRTLKVNMAPKITTENLYLSTPNVFELTYKQGANDHPFLHKFKTCALTDMSVNYTGDGVYATYDDATPISMIMDLTFKELEPIYDTDYDSVGGVGY